MASTDIDCFHKSQLENLCFICGEFCDQKKKSLVEHHQDELKAIFFLKDDCFNENTPLNFCWNCHAQVGNMKRPSSAIQIRIPDWKPHQSDNCSVCDKSPPERKVGRTPKKSKGKKGRPSMEAMPYWTRGDIEDILLGANMMPKISKLIPKLNSNLKSRVNQIFYCAQCHSIMEIPISNIKCEHSFCHHCIFPNLIGIKQNESSCPTCEINLRPGEVHVSKTLLHALENMTIPCNTCQKTQPILELCDHEDTCTDISKISDVFSMKEFPRHVENAVLHVIKHKMSGEKTVEFASGGPRVRFFLNMYYNPLQSSLRHPRLSDPVAFENSPGIFFLFQNFGGDFLTHQNVSGETKI